MYSDFIEYGFKDIDSFCRRIGGDNKVKSFDKEITISTWQSLHKNAHLFEGVGSIIADECHRSKSAVYEDIIFPCAINCSFRLGFTGTMPNEYIHKISILSSLGPTKKYISTRELINLGLATPVTINAVFLEYPNEERRKVLGLKYQDEVKYITNHSRRNSITTKLIEKIWKNRGNTMVLFDRVEHGKILAEGLVEHIFGKEVDYKELQLADNVYNIYLITGSSPPKEREKIRHLLEEKNDAILLGTSSILSTGINIKKLHNMVLTAGGKSNIKLNQSIGRMLRTHHSKEMVYIYDLVDNFSIQYKHTVRKNSFLKQFEERLGIYQDSEYDIKETTIQL
jgi:superfamily II DNA or RNA helicase